ncbi:hypothetical protein I3760_10G128600 [Carya illinoinensis]|nr:hypothetical protein I3760_10G128600 [Carya illinoinensis]
MADETPNPSPPLAPATSNRPTEIDHSLAPALVVVMESRSLFVTESECEQPTTHPMAEFGSLVVVDEKEDLSPPPPSVTIVFEVKTSATQERVGVVEAEKPKPTEDKKIPQSLVSFKEESNVVANILDSKQKSLQELRQLVQEALDSN